MLKTVVLLGLAANVAAADPVTPLASVGMLGAFAPLGIIEGGTVSVPKSGRARAGKVVIVRDRAGQPTAKRIPARTAAAVPPARSRAAAPARGCACTPGAGAAATADHAELRNTESGLRVMVMGPDGEMSTRSRFAPPPGLQSARHDDD